MKVDISGLVLGSLQDELPEATVTIDGPTVHKLLVEKFSFKNKLAKGAEVRSMTHWGSHQYIPHGMFPAFVRTKTARFAKQSELVIPQLEGYELSVYCWKSETDAETLEFRSHLPESKYIWETIVTDQNIRDGRDFAEKLAQALWPTRKLTGICQLSYADWYDYESQSYSYSPVSFKKTDVGSIKWREVFSSHGITLGKIAERDQMLAKLLWNSTLIPDQVVDPTFNFFA